MSTPLPENEQLLPAPLRAALPYLLLIFAVFGVYSNVYDNQFVFDDDLLIKMNSYLTGWNHFGDIVTGSTTSGVHIVGGFYRPVQIFLYLLVAQILGGTLFGYHFLNIALHAANACFTYRIGDKLGFDKTGSLLAALIWAMHPLHVEAITYMSATADPLFAFFCLWSIVILLPDITPRKILIIFPLFLLGLFSKETTVMFPALVMACLFYISPQRLNFRPYLRTWPLWAVSLTYVWWRMHATGFDGPQTYGRFYAHQEFSSLKLYAEQPLPRIYTFLATLPSYLNLLIWPTGLHMERSFFIFTRMMSVPVICGAVIFLLAAGQIVMSCRKDGRGLALSWSLLWFAAAHAPDMGILIPMNSLFLEHWMYLPAIGLFLGIGETLAHALENTPPLWRKSAGIMALCIAFALAAKTYEQNIVWRNPETFYTNIFAYGEKSARARNNLALYYSDEGRYAEAIEQFTEALKISDSYAETDYNLALTYLHMPNKQAYIGKAIDCLKKAIEIEPTFYRAYQMLGGIYSNILHDQKTADEYNRQAEEILSQRP